MVMEIIIYGSNVLSMHVCVYNKHMYTTLHTQHVWWELNYMYMYMYTVVSDVYREVGRNMCMYVHGTTVCVYTCTCVEAHQWL